MPLLLMPLFPLLSSFIFPQTLTQIQTLQSPCFSYQSSQWEPKLFIITHIFNFGSINLLTKQR
ncbi:hypothetical protein Hanom_Chr15g01345231 [Helianthus anomalus]